MTSWISADASARMEKVWPELLTRVVAGERYSVILASYKLTYYELAGYRASDPKRRAEWDIARKASADYFLDEVAETIANPDIHPLRARMMVDGYMRLAEKINPDRYAPRTRADINVRSVDLTAIISAAQQRVIGYESARLIGSQSIEERASLDVPALADLM